MNPELTCDSVHSDPSLADCSHSVHFLVRQTCSRSLIWFRRRADQRVIVLALGVGVSANPLIPRGNKPLNPWSAVPATLHCFLDLVNSAYAGALAGNSIAPADLADGDRVVKDVAAVFGQRGLKFNHFAPAGALLRSGKARPKPVKAALDRAETLTKAINRLLPS